MENALIFTHCLTGHIETILKNILRLLHYFNYEIDSIVHVQLQYTLLYIHQKLV